MGLTSNGSRTLQKPPERPVKHPLDKVSISAPGRLIKASGRSHGIGGL